MLSRSKNEKWGRLALGVVVLAYGVMMIGRTLTRGTDFLVFEEVARRFWSGVRPYDIETYGNLVFKYPPWILPAFFPFGWLDLKTSKLVWGVIQALSLAFLVKRMRRDTGAHPWTQVVVLLFYFGVFGLQGMLGQISLPLIALVIACRPLGSRLRTALILTWALTAKIFSVFPLLFLVWKRKDRLKLILGSFAIFYTLSLPIYFVSYERHYKWMKDEWIKACFSGVENKARGLVEFTNREAQGLPSLFFRQFYLDQENRWVVIGVVFGCLVVVAAFWAWLSRRLDFRTQWYGWLALLPVVQPLGWIHFFVFAYPLSILVLTRALQSRDRAKVAWTVFAIILIAAVTEKSFGKSFGGFLESWSVKSLGVLLLAYLSTWITPVEERPLPKAKTLKK